jgi:hypothetical protein
VIASHRTVSLAKALVSQTEESDYEFTISAQRYLVREGGIWRPFVRVSGTLVALYSGISDPRMAPLLGVFS